MPVKKIIEAIRPGRAVKSPGQTGKRINLALQGGGAHGAFTWGVLEHLLSDDRLVGIISVGDVIKVMYERLHSEHQHLMTYIHGTI